MVMADIKTPPFTKGKKQLEKVALTGVGNYLQSEFMWRGSLEF